MTAHESVLVIRPGSEEWCQLVTGSKIPAILGVSPYESPWDMWQVMTGRALPSAESDAMWRGNQDERTLRNRYRRDKHVRVRTPRIFISDDNPRYAYSPDGIVCGQPVLWEGKTAASADGWGRAGTDQIPAWYRPQVIWGMDLLGMDACDVTARIERLDNFKHYRVHADPVRAAAYKALVDQFMYYVDRDIQPPASWCTTDQSVTDRWPVTTDAAVDLADDPFIVHDVAELAGIRADRADGVIKEKAIKTSLHRAAGTAQHVTIAGQPAWSYRITTPERFDLTRFRADHPDLASQYTAAGNPVRTLILEGEQ